MQAAKGAGKGGGGGGGGGKNNGGGAGKKPAAEKKPAAQKAQGGGGAANEATAEGADGQSKKVKTFGWCLWCCVLWYVSQLFGIAFCGVCAVVTIVVVLAVPGAAALTFLVHLRSIAFDLMCAEEGNRRQQGRPHVLSSACLQQASHCRAWQEQEQGASSRRATGASVR